MPGSTDLQAGESPDAPKPTRVTADLPATEFALLKASRDQHRATTTDLTRALLRIHAADPDLARRVGAEIERVREEEALGKAVKRLLGMQKRSARMAARRKAAAV
ncbi:hypothetical protein [Actinacidiphila reveromycinica]|uniref:hypothetical protein n=1 Tax=Actinacidiphila reveromycinica TaxID=659352 RepID=UPI001923CB88|nr:hypothetical protein [Streptomyces sp. SN-593]